MTYRTMDTTDTVTIGGWSKRGKLLLLLILLIALGLRLWYLQVNTLLPQFSNADDGDYYQRAMRLAAAGRYVDDSWLIRPPLHVFVFAGLLRLGLALGGPATGVLLIQLFQSLIGVAHVALAADLARRLWRSERAGLLLGVALALYWPLIEAPAVLFSELIFTFFWSLHLWLLARFDQSSSRGLLFGSGLMLGVAALTRSPALYSLAFVAPWFWLRARSQGLDGWAGLRRALAPLLLLAAALLVIVIPWTARNYVVYQRLIVIDTLGPINVWLDLGETSQRNTKIELLRRMPQADRHIYAGEQARAILKENPGRLFRDAWPNFQHVWKAQFVEDFAVKFSFFGRPLRSVWLLGLLSDVIWIAIVLAAILGALRPAMALRWRLLLLLWLGYTLFTILIFHVEPRYLFPAWFAAAWLAAGVWAEPLQSLRELRVRPLRAVLAAATVLAFLALFFSYRDYPDLLSRMWSRERAWRRADAAYAAGQYQAAEQGYREALAAAPRHEDVKIGLALALAADGRLEEARSVVGGAITRRGRALRAYLLLRQGEREQALALWNELTNIASEDLQEWMRRVLPVKPGPRLVVGSGEDMGLVTGFGAGELSEGRSFRWTRQEAQVLLRAEAPLQPGARLVLELGAVPATEGALTPVTVVVNGERIALDVAPGWRRYQVVVPHALSAARTLQVEIEAPIFVPQQRSPAQEDRRGLGVMVSTVAIEQ